MAPPVERGATGSDIIVLPIVEPAAYGTDFTDLAADVSDAAFQPAPLPTARKPAAD